MDKPSPLVKQNVAAVILAGGKSSRMGRDKASLVFDGESLVERLARIVSPLVSHIIIMLHPEQKIPGSFDSVDAEVIIGRDSVPHQGPLQGIADAAELLPLDTEFAMVTACDLPFLHTEWLGEMVSAMSRSPELDAVVSREGPFLNPLIALYRKSVLQNATHCLKAGKSSCLALLDQCPYHCLELPKSASLILTNINTPEDYRQALNLKKSHR